MANTNGIEELKSERNIFNPVLQSAVRAELDLILVSPAFAQSNRCKRFLSFVVLQALAGHANELKERTIGVSVFDRAIDYDTGGDSIVRVTSNEVRKRIGQFYGESSSDHSVIIELPRGSYVPEFRVLPNRKEKEADQPIHSASSLTDIKVADIPPERVPIAASTEPHAALTQLKVEPIAEPAARRNRGTSRLLVAVTAILVVAGAAFGVWRIETHKQFPQIWEAFENAKSPVLICLGTHNLASSNTPAEESTERFSDLILHNEMIPVDDVTVITSMASILGRKKIPFRVMGAGQASLTDLRRQPIILIGGIDNRWTLRLTQDLRYQIKRVDPPGGKEPLAYIVDSRSHGDVRWTTDFSVPMYAWKSDYAVVARVDDPTTGVPVLIDAGLGNDGSLAASELLASDVIPNLLKAEPGCSGKTNFEAIIETQIIDAKPGPPHIVRMQCW